MDPSIDHITISLPSCTAFEIFDVEYSDIEILVEGHLPREFKHDLHIA